MKMSSEEGEESMSFGEVCAHAEVAIEFVASLTTNTTTELADEVGGEGVLLPLVLMFVSLVLAVRGGKLIKPSCVVAAAAVGFWAVWDLVHMLVGLQQISETSPTGGLPCEARLIGATVVALIAAVSAFCIIKLGLFLLGALAAGGTVYLFFDAFPELDVGPSLVANRSLIAWGITLLAGLLGGLLVRCNSKKVLELVTAVVGGFGVAHAVHGLVSVAGAELPGWGYIAIAVVVAVPGLWLQRRARLKSKESDSSSRYSESSSGRRKSRGTPVMRELSRDGDMVSVTVPAGRRSRDDLRAL